MNDMNIINVKTLLFYSERSFIKVIKLACVGLICQNTKSLYIYFADFIIF